MARDRVLGGRLQQAGRCRARRAAGGDASTRRPAATLAGAAGTGRPWSPSAPSRSFGPACARRMTCRGRSMSLYREPGRPEFDADELALILELAPYLAEGTRRGMLIGEASDPEGPDAPGLLVLRDDSSVESMTPGVERWLAELPDGDWEARERLPSAVLAVAQAGACGPRAASMRLARSRSRACSHNGPLDRAPWRRARVRPFAPRRGHHRARPSGPHHAFADGRLRVERARAGRHAPGAPGRIDRRDRRATPPIRLTRCRTTSRACSRRPKSAADASCSERCSSPTTSRACATTSGE